MGRPAGDVDELPSYFGDQSPPSPPSGPPRRPGRLPREPAKAPLTLGGPPGPRLVDRRFVRVVDVPLEQSTARLRDAPPLVLRVHLRRVPMELELGPWLVAGTHVELRPLRSVRASRRYFRAGHALLDTLVGSWSEAGRLR